MYDWDQANTRHIAEHNVTPEKAEQVIYNDPLDIPPPQFRNGELRFVHLGETDAGRVLFVVLTDRSGLLRVVTAYDADPKDRRYYANQRREQHGQKAGTPEFRQ